MLCVASAVRSKTAVVTDSVSPPAVTFTAPHHQQSLPKQATTNSSREDDAHTESRFEPEKAGNCRHSRHRVGFAEPLASDGKSPVRVRKIPTQLAARVPISAPWVHSGAMDTVYCAWRTSVTWAN